MTQLLAERIGEGQVIELLKAAPLRYSHFPSLAECIELIKEFGILRVYRGPEPDWISDRCPGIPASIEALCMMIESGQTGTGAFQIGLTVAGIDEVLLGDVYDDWFVGKLHPKLEHFRGIDRLALTRLKQKMALDNAAYYARRFAPKPDAPVQESMAF